MANVKELKANARPRGSKGAARAERREGRVPGIIYGDSKEPTAISVDRAELHQRILAGHFMTTLHDIEIDGTKHRVIPRDYQLDPVKDLPVHVDFMRLGEGAQIRVNIPIHIRNADQSPGLKRGGTINIVTHAVEVRVPADAIPDSIDVDLTGVDIGHSRHLSDVELPANVKVIGRRDLTLVTIVAPSGYLEEQKAAAEAAVSGGGSGCSSGGSRRGCRRRTRCSGSSGGRRSGRGRFGEEVIAREQFAQEIRKTEDGQWRFPSFARFWSRLTGPKNDQPPVTREEDAAPVMLILVGLGNPGAKHAGKRHNIGFMAIEGNRAPA